ALPPPAPERRAGGDLSPPRNERAIGPSAGAAEGIHAEERIEGAYDAELVRRLWVYIRPYRSTFLLSMAILPLASGLMLAQPYLLKIGLDRYVATNDFAGLSRVAALFLAAVVGEFAALYFQYYFTMVVAQRSLADLRNDLFTHLERLPQGYFDRNPVGRLV